ncbi:MAG TPA: phosphatase PAP2 family protein [Steroidobacteraceae bacterium]|nr:phosphatase PAP2 family protein [Steroidobacteraceae bacterium]
MRLRALQTAVSLILMAAAPAACLAGGGLLGLDHEWSYDNSGIWKRPDQLALEYGIVGFEVIGAVWEGGDDRFGRTLWQSIDASASSGIVALALKYSFSRVRPIDSGGDPNLWFKGHGNQSFPSGEVTLVSSVVTPLVLEYRHDQPWIYALEALPLYDAIARMKLQAHWQSDVLAGFALGTGAGWLMHGREGTPLILGALPHGFYVGLKKEF